MTNSSEPSGRPVASAARRRASAISSGSVSTSVVMLPRRSSNGATVTRLSSRPSRCAQVRPCPILRAPHQPGAHRIERDGACRQHQVVFVQYDRGEAPLDRCPARRERALMKPVYCWCAVANAAWRKTACAAPRRIDRLNARIEYHPTGGRPGGRSQVIGSFRQVRTSRSNDIPMWRMSIVRRSMVFMTDTRR